MQNETEKKWSIKTIEDFKIDDKNLILETDKWASGKTKVFSQLIQGGLPSSINILRVGNNFALEFRAYGGETYTYLLENQKVEGEVSMKKFLNEVVEPSALKIFSILAKKEVEEREKDNKAKK